MILTYYLRKVKLRRKNAIFHKVNWLCCSRHRVVDPEIARWKEQHCVGLLLAGKVRRK